MGSGLVQVVLLLVATVIGLPCFFFTLLALLDRFEQRLTAGTPALVAARPVQVVQVVPAEEVATIAGDQADSKPDLLGAAVVELPVSLRTSTAPASATG